MDANSSSSRGFPRGVLIALVVVVVALVGLAGAAIGAAVTDDDDSPAVASQGAWVQGACHQWFDADPSEVGTRGWCAAMTDWMLDNMNDNGMGPSTMWGDPTRMREACQQWMTTDSPQGGSATDGTTWCDSMVDGMTDHMGSWDDWEDWDQHWTMHDMMRS